jgi:hypothetical protein
MAAYQVLGRGCGGRLRIGTMYYDREPTHKHWHLRDFERYYLAQANRRRQSLSTSRKIGFCVGDSFRVVSRAGSPRFDRSEIHYCEAGDPGTRTVHEGLTPGWADYYGAGIEGQYVELTVPAGKYLLMQDVNPHRAIREISYAQDTTGLELRVEWPGGRRRAPHVTIVAVCTSSSCRRIVAQRVPVL